MAFLLATYQLQKQNLLFYIYVLNIFWLDIFISYLLVNFPHKLRIK